MAQIEDEVEVRVNEAISIRNNNEVTEEEEGIDLPALMASHRADDEEEARQAAALPKTPISTKASGNAAKAKGKATPAPKEPAPEKRATRKRKKQCHCHKTRSKVEPFRQIRGCGPKFAKNEQEKESK